MPTKNLHLGKDSNAWRWVVVFAAFLLSLLTDGVRFSFGLLYKELLVGFNKGRGVTAGIGSLMFGTMNFSAPVASILINRLGCRFTATLGSVVYCVGLIASSLTPNFIFLYFSFGIVSGLAYSFMYVTISVVILQYFDKKKSFANGIALCGSGIGGFVFNPLVNFLFDTYSWRGALLLVAGIILQGTIAGMLMRPAIEADAMDGDNKKLSEVYERESIHTEITEITFDNIATSDHKDTNTETAKNKKDGSPTESIKSRTISKKISAEDKAEKKRPLFAWHLLKEQRFVLFMFNQFFLAFGYMIPFTYLPEIITSYGYSQNQAVWVMSAMSIVGSVSRVASGWLADRKFINRRVLFCVAYFVAALAVSSLYICRRYELIMFACIVYSISSGCIVATIAIIVADLFGTGLLSDAYGLSIFARGPGNVSGAPISGWIVDESGMLHLVFLVSGLAFVLAGISVILSVRTKDRLRV